MKKKYFFNTLLLFIFTINATSQVVNGNFETVKPNFLPSNWGMNFLQSVTFNPTTGQNSADTIVFTSTIPSMVYATTDAHTGQYAMELSNAFNQTQNTVIPGEAVIFNDASQDSPGWNPGVPVSPEVSIQRLGFYYKFLPLGNDIAEAKISVVNANGDEIGQTRINITGTNNQFQYIYSYVYTAYNASPAFMFISFNMAKAGSTPTFGSRLIIDNVITNAQSLSLIENQSDIEFKVYPTLVDNKITIDLPSQAEGEISYKIYNSLGNMVKEHTEMNPSDYSYKMTVSDLSAGMYFLQIDSNLEKTTTKFIKK